MKWEKALGIAVVCYLAVAIPLYLFNAGSVNACEKACLAEGYDTVISAIFSGNETKCRCLDSITRAEKYITVPQGQ